MSSSLVAVEESPFVVRAEQALRTLQGHIVTHSDRESNLRRMCGELQETWLSRINQLRQQVNELEARLSPWMPRGESFRLVVVAQNDETA
ncbi:MAG: hypothetical protein JWP89_340 [Schlesneria sp.]|nr:hypothetical protein [Schlesneria sp.]